MVGERESKVVNLPFFSFCFFFFKCIHKACGIKRRLSHSMTALVFIYIFGAQLCPDAD